MQRGRRCLAGFASRRRYSSKTHAEGFRSWTLPPLVGSDGGPKTIVVRIPELPSSNPIDPGLSLPKKIPLPLAHLAPWRFNSLFSPSSSTSRDLRSVALQSLVAGRHRHGLPRDATATFNIRDPRSSIRGTQSLVAGRHRHGLPRDATATFNIRDPRSSIRGTQSLVAGRHRHGLPRDATATFNIRDPRSPPAAEYWPGAGYRRCGRFERQSRARARLDYRSGTLRPRPAAGRRSHFPGRRTAPVRANGYFFFLASRPSLTLVSRS